MPIVAAIMVPHPPLIVPQVGRGHEKQVNNTIQAYRQAARWLLGYEPESLIISSPHAPMYTDYFRVSSGAANGNFAQFGAPDYRQSVAGDPALADEIQRLAAAERFPAGTKGGKDALLDHGTMVPLHFLMEAAQGDLVVPVVRVSLSGLPYKDHYRLGQLIAKAADNLGRRVAFVASGDLSHYLTHTGPYGYRPQGPEYDAIIMDIMGRTAFGELLQLPPAFCEGAGECGQRSFVIMAGALDGRMVQAQCLSYEGVTGVGYGVCTFLPGKRGQKRTFA